MWQRTVFVLTNKIKMLLNNLRIFEINGSRVIFGEQVLDPVCQDVLSPRLEIVISVAGGGAGGLPKTPAFGGPSPPCSEFSVPPCGSDSLLLRAVELLVVRGRCLSSSIDYLSLTF